MFEGLHPGVVSVMDDVLCDQFGLKYPSGIRIRLRRVDDHSNVLAEYSSIDQGSVCNQGAIKINISGR